MVPFAPVAFRPAVSSPAARRSGLGAFQSPSLGQTFDQYFGWSPAAGDVVRLVFHGATASLGFRVWLKDTGFFKWFGLLLALGQTVGAICDVMSLVQRAAGTHPAEHPEGER